MIRTKIVPTRKLLRRKDTTIYPHLIQFCLNLLNNVSVSFKSIQQLIKLKVQFGFASLLATGIDYTLFLLLVNLNINAVKAHYITASIGMLVNFIVQNQYVFIRERNLLPTFVLSLLVSIIGIYLGGLLMGKLQQLDFWGSHLYMSKIAVTAVTFFYNFYFKRLVFEKRFL